MPEYSERSLNRGSKAFEQSRAKPEPRAKFEIERRRGSEGGSVSPFFK